MNVTREKAARDEDLVVLANLEIFVAERVVTEGSPGQLLEQEVHVTAKTESDPRAPNSSAHTSGNPSNPETKQANGKHCSNHLHVKAICIGLVVTTIVLSVATVVPVVIGLREVEVRLILHVHILSQK